MPIFHRVVDGEDAHKLAIILAKYGFVPRGKQIKNEEILVIFQIYQINKAKFNYKQYIGF